MGLHSCGIKDHLLTFGTMSQDLASFPGVIRTILLVLLLFFVARILGRIFLPMIAQQRKGSTNRNNSSAPHRPEGEVRVEQIRKNASNDAGSGKHEGEYVDYKEVD